MEYIYIYISNIAIRIHPTFLQYGPGSVFPETCGVELGTQKSNFRWVLFLGSALLACIAIWVTEGILEVKLAPVWTDGKADGKSQRREEKRREEKRREERRSEAKRSEAKGREEKRREEKRRREKIREEKESEERRCTRVKMFKKWRNTVFFQCFVAPGGPKVGSLKRRVRSHLAGCESKNCTPLWREAHFEDKQLKTHHIRSTFGSWDDGKSARRWGAKHISESKCAKHTLPRTLLEVEMMKKCTPLWREARFQVKMCKTHQLRSTFGSWDVEQVYAVVARRTFPSQNVKDTTC